LILSTFFDLDRMDSKKDSAKKRFTDPIPSFPGKPPTESELKIISEMIQYIQQDEVEKIKCHKSQDNQHKGHS
jgi:hypothetical protein